MTQRLRYTELAPHGIVPLRALEHFCNTETQLDPVLLGLVRLRASHLNGCEYCIGLHTHELAKHNETAGRIAHTANPQGFEGYTHREQAAFAWTDAVTDIQQGHASDEAYASARAHFNDTELVNLTLAIVSINAWNRLAIAFRAEHVTTPQPPNPSDIQSEPQQPEPPTGNDVDTTGDDGGKVAVDQ